MNERANTTNYQLTGLLSQQIIGSDDTQPHCVEVPSGMVNSGDEIHFAYRPQGWAVPVFQCTFYPKSPPPAFSQNTPPTSSHPPISVTEHYSIKLSDKSFIKLADEPKSESEW